MGELLFQTFLIILLTFAIGMAVALLIDLLVRVMDSANIMSNRHEVIKRRRKIRKAGKSIMSNIDYLNYIQNKRH